MDRFNAAIKRIIENPENDGGEILYVDELGWIDDEFYVWVSNIWFEDFIALLINEFGYSLFDDGGMEATVFDRCICINITCVESYGVDLEELWPKYKYLH